MDLLLGIALFGAILFVSVAIVARLRLSRDLSPAMKEIHAICQALEDGRISVIPACHEISRNLPFLTRGDVFFGNGRAFEEIDANICSAFPVGKERDSWAPEALAKKDYEMKQAEARIDIFIRKECRRILHKRSHLEFWK